jgi:hypothetical protein
MAVIDLMEREKQTGKSGRSKNAQRPGRGVRGSCAAGAALLGRVLFEGPRRSAILSGQVSEQAAGRAPRIGAAGDQGSDYTRSTIARRRRHRPPRPAKPDQDRTPGPSRGRKAELQRCRGNPPTGTDGKTARAADCPRPLSCRSRRWAMQATTQRPLQRKHEPANRLSRTVR